MPASINDIELHVQSYRSALKSNLEITINSLSNPHIRLESILHPYAGNPDIVDFSALVYSLLRLPPEIDDLNLVIMGQNPDVFSSHGFPEVEKWPMSSSAARRRTNFINRQAHICASLIGSISDVDDIVNLLIAYQFEWNKFHLLVLKKYPSLDSFKKAVKSQSILRDLSIAKEDWDNFLTALGSKPSKRLDKIYAKFHDIRIRLLAGSWVDYTKTVQRWWKNVASTTSHLPSHRSVHMSKTPIYFVSSNTHSLLNLFTGYPLKVRSSLLKNIKADYPALHELWQQINSGNNSLPEPDFLFYASKFYQSDPTLQKELRALQKKIGCGHDPKLSHSRHQRPNIPLAKYSKVKVFKLSIDDQ